jgi:2-C-methyl-D-erythritol 2,4-cyclodiphosphate synthase
MAIRTRVGQGFDIHRFVDGPSDRVLVLGGVKFPNEKPLVGHSDADVIAHAAADALLGAASLGDIGMHFPDTDPQWAGANSLTLLAHVAKIVRDAGYEIGNVELPAGQLQSLKGRRHETTKHRWWSRTIPWGTTRNEEASWRQAGSA